MSSVRSSERAPSSRDSVRGSDRNATAAASNAAAAGSSVRSAAAAAPSDANALLATTASQRSRATATTTGGSQRSITSSVAIEQLRQLDDVLARERMAREEAERTLQILHQERAAKDTAARRSERTERQLQTILKTIQKVINEPSDGARLRQLQRIAARGANAPSSAASDSSSVRSLGSAAPGNGAALATAAPAAPGAVAVGVAAAAAAPRSASTPKRAAVVETFFEKFGNGDARQRAAIDRAVLASSTSVPAPPPRGAAPVTMTFKHKRSDLRPEF
jgi:hypothetical protein